MPVQLSYDVETYFEDTQKFLYEQTRDRGRKKVILGLSGGLDSAVVFYSACRSVGTNNVIPVWMPSDNFETRDHTDVLVEAQGIPGRLVIAPLGLVVETIQDQMPMDYKPWSSLLEGNVKARLRMIYLYHIAKCEKGLVLGTSNRSEWLTGYFTKWGDSCGDLWPILGLYKTEVRELAHYLGVPMDIVNKAPSAGFYEGQTDEDELGVTYEVLDQILVDFVGSSNRWPRDYKIYKALIEKWGEDLVEQVRSLVVRSQHKRNSFRMRTQFAYPPRRFI